MAWKRQSTRQSVDVDIDLTEFEELELLQGLINSKWITENEAEAISKRAKVEGSGPALSNDGEELAIARDCIRIGDRREALIHLERFLGRDFMGMLA